MHKHISIKHQMSKSVPSRAEILDRVAPKFVSRCSIAVQCTAPFNSSPFAKSEALEALKEGDAHSAANTQRVVAALGEQIGAALGGEEHRQQ